MTSYGYFDDKNKEYVITNPKTPVKWINYIGTLKFGGFVDHTGGGVICKADPALNRITKYIAQTPNSDFKAETLYIRIKENGKYKVFSAFFTPTLDKYDLFETHVGLGYTRIISEFYGVRTEATIFVPRNAQAVVRDIKVTNKSGKELEIDVIPVVEYSHPDSLKQLTNADWVPQTMTSVAHQHGGGLVLLEQYPFMCRDTKINYFTSNQPVSSYDSDRRVFLGDNEYGTFMAPLALTSQDELNNTQVWRGDNIAALLHHLGKMKSGETKRVITQLGQDDSVKNALPNIEKYRNEKNVDAAFNEIAAFWNEYLSVMQVETPDKSMNSMLNVHNPRQCYMTKNWSRYLSLYQLGYGARGIGYRDSSQDVLGVIASAPQEAKELILKLLHVQKRDGSAMHQFNPLTMIATEGDSLEVEGGHRYYSDDHLWIVYATTFYIKETGDFSILDEVVPYYEKDKMGEPLEKATVLDHLHRGIEFTRHNLGKHGMPLLGFADWNDTVNLPGQAESVLVAQLYGRALFDLIELAEKQGDKKAAEKFQKYYADMKDSVNKNAWDGEWWIRYFEDSGAPLGTNKNEKGKMFIEAQPWPVISGLATPERGKQALDSLNKNMNTKYGIKVQWPSYNGFDWRKGGVTTYPPGAKENGGIFLHTNPWVMIAETILGNGDRAYQYYDQINPASKNDIIDTYELSPYVYAQNILGDEHPQFGMGRNCWLSGTSAWVYTAATKYILGVMPTYEGLQISPCIPKKWDGFKVVRKFRGVNYNVTVKNPNHVSCGVVKMIVDGKEIAGNVIPLQNKDVNVEVVLGANGVTNSIYEKIAAKAK